MAIKIIKHKREPEKLAYKFLCDCGCEFWSDADSVIEVSSCGVFFFIKPNALNAVVLLVWCRILSLI